MSLITLHTPEGVRSVTREEFLKLFPDDPYGIAAGGIVELRERVTALENKLKKTPG